MNAMEPSRISIRMCLLVVIWLLCLCGQAFGSNPTERPFEAGLPPLQAFGPKAYRGHPQNWAIVQDHRGVVYFGNDTSGVLEFDGVDWRAVTVSNNTTVRSLDVDRNGRVYVGAVGELGYVEADALGQLRYVSLVDQIPPDQRDFADVLGTFATDDGVYFSTFSRLFLVQERQVRVWNPTTEFMFAFRVKDSVFLQERGRGLFELVDGELTPVPGSELLIGETIRVMLPWRDPETGLQSILVATHASQYALDPTGLRRVSTSADDLLERDRLYTGAALQDGTLALGTLQGGVQLLKADGTVGPPLNTSTGLPDNAVNALLQDKEHGLWVATDNGIARVDVSSPVTQHAHRSGLEGAVLSVGRHEGTLYAGTAQGVSQMQPVPQGAPHFVPVPGIFGQTWFVLGGDALLLANAAGVYELRDNVAKLVRPSPHTALVLHHSKVVPNRVFVGMSDGIASMRQDSDTWVDEGRIADVSVQVRTLLEGPDGRLWVGTQNRGLLRLTFPTNWRGDAAGPPVQVERFGVEDGLPSAVGNQVHSVRGGVSFTTTEGVFRFDDVAGRFAPDQRFHDLFRAGAGQVGLVTQDPDGRVWMKRGNESGTQEVGFATPMPDGTYRWESGPLGSFGSASFDQIVADDDGVMWFAGPDGLFRYDPSMGARADQPFEALIRKVSSRGSTLVYGGSGKAKAAILEYADNAVRFEFAAPSFDGGGANRFQVLLDGVDQDWTHWSAEPYRDYTNILEGDYRFRVRAKNAAGISGQEAVYPFRILPPWYRTWWAYLGYGIVGAVFIGTGSWLRFRRLEWDKRTLEEKVEARTEALERKTEYLETLHAIAKVINERTNIDEVLRGVLDECQRIKGVEASSALVIVPGQEVFTYRVHSTWVGPDLTGVELSSEEAEELYTGSDAEPLSEDISFIPMKRDRLFDDSKEGLLVVRVRLDGAVVGYFLYQSTDSRRGFDASTISLLKGLTEHFVAAFHNARMLALLEHSKVELEVRVAKRTGELAHSMLRLEREVEVRKQAEEAATAASATKSRFLANMSHELRTPLNAIIGYSEMVLEETEELPAFLSEDVSKIHRSAQHLLSMIDTILDLSAIEAEAIRLNVSRIDVAPLLEQVMQTVQPMINANGNVASWECEQGLSVEADGQRVRQILLNLVSNASKFTNDGEISVRAVSTNDWVRVSITDTGIGIPEDVLPTLFQEFTQVDNSSTRRFDGTGLGLAISRRLAQALGGDVDVQSALGKGSTFTVSLRRWTDDGPHATI